MTIILISAVVGSWFIANRKTKIDDVRGALLRQREQRLAMIKRSEQMALSSPLARRKIAKAGTNTESHTSSVVGGINGVRIEPQAKQH